MLRFDEAIGSKEWAKRQFRERAERVSTLQEQLATLQAQLLSMLGPQPPSEPPPSHLMTNAGSSSSNTIAPKAKAVPAPQAPEDDLAEKLAKRRRKD